MTDLIHILSQALSSTPSTIIPFLFTLVLIGYLSFKIYQEFKKVYKKVNDVNIDLNNRVAKVEGDIAKTDERTLMLSQKLERIEESLNRMNRYPNRTFHNIEIYERREEEMIAILIISFIILLECKEWILWNLEHKDK